MSHAGIDGLNLPGYHHHHAVQKVHAPVEHHAAALLLHTPPVAGYAAAAVIAGLDMEHVAQGLLLKELLYGQIVLVPAAVLPGIEPPAGLLRDLQHLLEVPAVHHNGLLAEHAFAGLHGPYRQLLMAVIRGGYQNHVHLGVVQYLLKAAVSIKALFTCPLLTLLLHIEGAGKCHFGL